MAIQYDFSSSNLVLMVGGQILLISIALLVIFNPTEMKPPTFKELLK